MFEDALPIFVQLDNIKVMVGDYPSSHASIVLPISDAPNPGFKIVFIATVKDKKIFQILGWRSFDWPFCLSEEYVRKLGLAEAIKRSRFSHWTPSCGWEFRQPSGVYGVR